MRFAMPFLPFALGFCLLTSPGRVPAQAPGASLDAAWVVACAGAVPGSAFSQRCQEILNAGPGSGDRRSEAALGNNLDTLSSQGRMASAANGDTGRIDWATGGLFVGVTTRDVQRTGSDADAGYDGTVLSAILGVDRRLAERHVLGLALNHQRETARFAGGSGRVQGSHLGLLATYGASLSDAWSVDAYAGSTRGDLEIARRVAYALVLNAGTAEQSTVEINALAQASTDVRRNLAGVSLGYAMSRGAWQWQFGTAFDAVRSRIDGYVELDGGGLALAVNRQRVDSRQARVGVRAARAGSTWFGVLQPFASLDLMHEFADDSRQLQVAFAGDAGRSPIRFDTTPPDRDWAEASVGLEAVLAGGSSAFLVYQQRFGDQWLDERSLGFGLRVEF